MRKKLGLAVSWALSPAGRKDLGALIGLLTAIYTGLHRAGV